ncbi:hypothetical protein M427DRAFT_29819 [Gonapodya prolifera JEL478]|uniref:Uncharacterized protein n=1 Tax=Gonapodya prolifera (strain JEL478) TaxID=1344416 RepID=A0A139AP55_GONPJ|nr:hypothetical protein M427DRAFT_29819 [Gonapodya prolifera JEL478]|eukprot:KXS18541.1 hypothetical protein M427DRAFT_29819 [Gonapodya prolifera JEL478]
MALRSILNAPSHTSEAALHRILVIPLVKDRCREINFLGASHFHNNTDQSTLGVDIWRRAAAPLRTPPASSLPKRALTHNTWCVELRHKLINHSTTPLTRVNPTITPPPLLKPERKKRMITTLINLDKDEGNIAASVLVKEDGKHHHFLTAKSPVSREHRVTITRWQIGVVAHHNPLLVGLPHNKRFGKTPIDWVINALAGDMSSLDSELLVKAITKIEEDCRGREQTENGFFK